MTLHRRCIFLWLACVLACGGKPAAEPKPPVVPIEGQGVQAEVADPEPAESPQPSSLIEVTAREILLKEPIRFEDGDISPASHPVLAEVAQALRNDPTISLDVVGHTGAGGVEMYNLALAMRVASQVCKHLIGLGIAEDRLHPVARGEMDADDANPIRGVRVVLLRR